MARPPRRRPARFSIAPIYLVLGLILGYQLLVRFVPMVWASMLPGGLDQASQFRGWPAVVWHFSRYCRLRFPAVVLILGGAAGLGFLLSALRPLRIFVWLAAIAVVAVDAGILIVTLRTAMTATMQDAGIGPQF
jgi:hypothetical protein